jgi:uncharacterized protein YbjT (DUF2867 family)
VNAVSLYVEHGSETFHSVHVETAPRIAAQAQRAGVKRLVHVSGIGADPRSQSLYIRKRGEGELAVREAFADAILIRPAVMFGLDDAFLTTILKLLDRLPIYPGSAPARCDCSQSTWKASGIPSAPRQRPGAHAQARQFAAFRYEPGNLR